MCCIVYSMFHITNHYTTVCFILQIITLHITLQIPIGIVHAKEALLILVIGLYFWPVGDNLYVYQKSIYFPLLFEKN